MMMMIRVKNSNSCTTERGFKSFLLYCAHQVFKYRQKSTTSTLLKNDELPLWSVLNTTHRGTRGTRVTWRRFP